MKVLSWIVLACLVVTADSAKGPRGARARHEEEDKHDQRQTRALKMRSKGRGGLGTAIGRGIGLAAAGTAVAAAGALGFLAGSLINIEKPSAAPSSAPSSSPTIANCALGAQEIGVCGTRRRGLQGVITDDQTQDIRDGFNKASVDWFAHLDFDDGAGGLSGECGGSLVHGDSKYLLARLIIHDFSMDRPANLGCRLCFHCLFLMQSPFDFQWF